MIFTAQGFLLFSCSPMHTYPYDPFPMICFRWMMYSPIRLLIFSRIKLSNY